MPLILLVLFFVLAVPAGAEGPLSVKEGRLCRDGQPYRGIGINYHDAFFEALQNAADGGKGAPGFHRGLKFLGQKGIPFVRFAACGFFPREWRFYQADPERYFAIMDDLVRTAERNGVGLVPSLFWAYFVVPDVVGEPISAWGSASSRTRQFMRKYTREIVSRYRNSPAIWAWEFGNEYLSEADLPGPVSPDHWVVPQMGTPRARGEPDRLLSRYMADAYRDFGRVVRELDSARPIMTGDAAPRVSAWHLARNEGWKFDSAEQWRAALAEANPDPIDTISLHFYHPKEDGKGYPGYGIKGMSVPEMLTEAAKVAGHVGKPVWLGEFGAGLAEPDEAARRRQVSDFLEWIVAGNVSLAAYWVFDSDNPDLVVWAAKPGGANGFVFDMIVDANRRLRGAGAH